MQKKLFFISLIAITLLTACSGKNGPDAADPNAADESADDTESNGSKTESNDTADTSDENTDEGTTIEGDIKVDVDADGSVDTGTDTSADTDDDSVTDADTDDDNDTGTTANAVTEISVVGDEFKYIPQSISVKAGEKVKINFKNEGNFPHNIAIEELSLTSAVIGTGETTTLEFTAPAAGTYTIYCSVAGHRDAGMEGDLVSQ